MPSHPVRMRHRVRCSLDLCMYMFNYVGTVRKGLTLRHFCTVSFASLQYSDDAVHTVCMQLCVIIADIVKHVCKQ